MFFMSLEKRPGDVTGAIVDAAKIIAIIGASAMVTYEALIRTEECPIVLKKCPPSIGQLAAEQFNSLRDRLFDFS